MSDTYVPRTLRGQVELDARHRCGYCLTPQRIIGRPMVIDHIKPEMKGGETVRENLWLACRRWKEQS
ncbi:MAG: HNH endonuclease [Anaerolineae bacterium]|nr:HNH endonuclease [Anaerolineae bacterium]